MKNKHTCIVGVLFFLVFSMNAQVGIGTTSPDESAILDIQSENAGILLPRIHINDLTKKGPIKNDSIPEGLLVYNTNSKTGKGFCFWNGDEWEFINPAKEKKKSLTTTHNYVSVADAGSIVQDLSIPNTGLIEVSDSINKLIEAISQNTRENKTLFFPQGTYLINKPIILKENLGILGENLRTTFIVTDEGFTGHAMIQNFAGNSNPQTGDTTATFYNNIENLTLRNYYTNPNLVMMWLVHQWEGSYVKNIHLYNGSLPNTKTDAIIRGGLWHTKDKPVNEGGVSQGGGGQFVVENINIFYGDGVCNEENVKLINSGGLYCRDWNINNFNFPKNPTNPVVHLETSTLVLDASNIHIEKTPGNHRPSLKLKGGLYTAMKLSNSDIDASSTGDEAKVGIEIDISSVPSEVVEYDIENVSLKNSTGGIFDAFYQTPIRIISPLGIEYIANDNVNEKITGIRKFTKTIRSFNNMPAQAFKDAIGIGEGIIYQQSIGPLSSGQSVKINTPHMMKRTFKKNLLDNQLATAQNGQYEAKGYLVLISSLNNYGNSIGGLFYVLESKGPGAPDISINEIFSTIDIDLYEENNALKLKNVGLGVTRNLTRLNVLIIGTGTND